MRQRLLYISGIVLLVLSATLVIWQGSFDFGEHGPVDPSQTLIFWAVSSLVFLLFVTLGFMLFRTGVKLYIERRSNREGSRIRTKLVLGALALSFMPVVFLVLFSVQVLNKNLDKWFSKPAEVQRLNFIELAVTLDRALNEKARVQAELLAGLPEVALALRTGSVDPEFLKRFCAEHSLDSAAVLRAGSPLPIASFGPVTMFQKKEVNENVTARHAVGSLGFVAVADRVPLDIAEKQRSIERYNRFYGELAVNRRNSKYFYLLYLALITLFVLFVATWIARILAGQISTPIAAVLHAAGEVRKGNLSYRVEVEAIDELAGLVRGFNEMTRELEANSRELDARRRFTEAILESIPTGVISISADGTIQRVNRALHAILPHAPTGPGVRLEDLFSREDRAEIKYLMKRARRTGLASSQMDVKLGRQTLHLAVTVSALEDRLNSGFVLVIEDTSDLMRAQQAAAWNEVARRIAHEIKNPLTPIALSAERIRRQLDRLSLPAEVMRIVRECTATITNEVESVKTLVDEFSRFARFPAAQPVRCDLNEVVESALSVFAGRLDGIQVRVQLAPNLPAVNLDRELFKRVVVNLVDNAAEAMQDSPVKEIDIVTQAGPAGGTVELAIADTGCGVSADEKEKLFLPYFSTKGRGTGLGLAIVNHILSDHGARIRVDDNEPAGTSFTIEIPVLIEGGDEGRMPEPAGVTGLRA